MGDWREERRDCHREYCKKKCHKKRDCRRRGYKCCYKHEWHGHHGH